MESAVNKLNCNYKLKQGDEDQGTVGNWRLERKSKIFTYKLFSKS